MRSPLIVIEGLDRTGKSTQTKVLVDRLNSLKISNKLIRFPERSTPVGQLINRYLSDSSFQLSDQAAHLLFSANRWEFRDSMVDLLTKKQTLVLLDRYAYSGVAYSAAKGLDFDWCLNPDVGMPEPDAVIFLKFKQEAGNSDRDGFGDERYEKKEFQDKVRAQFDKFEGQTNWHTIYVDGKSIAEVARDIWNVVGPLAEGVDADLKSI